MAGLVTLGTLAAACAGPPSRATLVAPAPSVEPITPLEAFPATASSKRAVARSAGAENPQIAAQFDAYLAAYPDLTVDGLRRELPLPSRRAEVPLPFDPSQAKYFDLVTTQLQMTQAESGQLRRAGVAVVDHAQAYSMAACTSPSMPAICPC
jgi:hypothetical protein